MLTLNQTGWRGPPASAMVRLDNVIWDRKWARTTIKGLRLWESVLPF